MKLSEVPAGDLDNGIPNGEQYSSHVDKAYEQHHLDTTADALERDDPAADQRIEELKDALGIPEKKETNNKEEDLEYAQKVIEAFGRLEKIMYERYGKDAFHNLDHVREFEESAVEILNLIKGIDPTFVVEDDELAVRTIARGHDIVVNYQLNIDPKSFQYGQRMRIRGWELGDVPANLKDAVDEVHGGNEKESAEETVQILKETDPEQDVFKDSTYKKVWDGIAATYPEAGMAPIPEEHLMMKVSENAEIDLRPYLMKDKDHEGVYLGLKFNQKYLTPDSSITTLASGLADLSYVGKVSAEEFKNLGNAEYRELRELIGSQLKDGIDKIPPESKAKIAADMLNWMESQVGFALHQRIRFHDVINSNKAINSHPQGALIKETLIGKYRAFDSNIIAAKDRVQIARERFAPLKDPASYPALDELFNELTKEMGYTLE
jgi:hypothetical protein